MEKLNAVNRVLRNLGIRPVTALTVQNPSKDLILQDIDDKLYSLLRKGFWFNQRSTTLYPDTNNQIIRPASVISAYHPTQFEFYGNILTDTATGSSLFTTAQTLKVQLALAFEEVPEVIAEYVVAACIYDRYLADYGADGTLSKHELAYARAKSELDREVLRNSTYSAKTSGMYQRITAAVRGSRGNLQ